VSVKALARGLQVLSAVNELNPAYVKDVVELTALPKATVIRLLKSLVDEGYVVSDPSGHGYRVSVDARKLSRALGDRSAYATVSEPVLTRLGQTLKYPAIFSVVDTESLVIEATNRHSAPIRLKLFERSRIPILSSAAGMAYLSALPSADAQLAIAKELARDGVQEAASIDAPAIIRSIEQSRQQGYAAQRYDTLDDITAIAVPVGERDAPVGALSLVYYETLMHPEIRDGLVLPNLRKSAEAITAAMRSNPDEIGATANYPAVPASDAIAVGGSGGICAPVARTEGH